MDHARNDHERHRADSWPSGRVLAPLEPADLPDPPDSPWAIIGPGVVAAGVGLGASEFILFPYIASQVGLTLVWAAILVVILQFFLTMEVERYTLATGETILTGFGRLGRFWPPLFCVMAVLSAMWPGWATSAGTLMSYLFGGEPRFYALSILLFIGVVLTLSPVVYRSLERAEFIKVASVGLLFLGSIALAIPGEVVAEAAASLMAPSLPVEALGWPMVLGALAYAGTGGNAILCQSNWIRDKGFGMGSRAPKIVSPFVGRPVASSGTGWRFELSEEMMVRWRAWWRFANIEQLATFVTICIVTIVFTSVLAFALLYGRDGLPSDIGFLRVQGEVIAERVAPWFRTLFWSVGALALFATALGVVDLTSRLIADVVRTMYAKNASESGIYAAAVWSLLAVGISIVMFGTAQPVVLLITSASLSGLMMVMFAPLLLVLNHRLPRLLRPSMWRRWVLVAGTLLFGALTLATAGDFLGWI